MPSFWIWSQLQKVHGSFCVTTVRYCVTYLGQLVHVSCRARRYGLSQVAIHPQLSCHVTLRFSRHAITVLVITFSYDIETGHSWIRWKGDDDAVVLDLVLAPEGLWIILCDHGKLLRHLFGPTWPCIMSGLKSKLWAPNPWPFPTLGQVLDYKHSRRHC
jgi:hypothetical protein